MPKVTGSFAAIGVSQGLQVEKDFNIALSGTFTGTVQLERQFSGDPTWYPCSLNSAGDIASYTTGFSATVREPEGGVSYRFNCTAFSSGPINYRISQ